MEDYYWADGIQPALYIDMYARIRIWTTVYMASLVALLDRHNQASLSLLLTCIPTAHLEPGPGQRLARRINRRAQSLLAHGIQTEIHWVLGHSGIPGNEEADRQANAAHDASWDTVIERPYTSASNMARRISKGRSVAKARWEADKCSKHFCYRLKGKAGTKRPIPMTSVKSLAARFY